MTAPIASATADLDLSDSWSYGPGVELTVLLRCQPVDGWLRVVQRAKLVQAGWLDEECEIWDSTDSLVVQARQVAGFRVE